MPDRPRLILILGDQLSPGISSLRHADPARDTVLMAEVAAEAGYADHHKQKLVLVFSAMRHFAEELRGAGWRVTYRRIDDPDAAPDLRAAAADALRETGAESVAVTEPGEWRLWDQMQDWPATLGVPVDLLADDRFIVSREEFEAWASGRRNFIMEHFYRMVRRKTGLLMEGDQPAGDRWNFDAENRTPAKPDLFLPQAPDATPDAVTEEVVALVRDRFAGHVGRLDQFRWHVTRAGAEAARDWFIANALPDFGRFQDAMLLGQPHLYHSLLSPYLNIGLLDPLDLCRRAEAEWRAGRAPLNSVEGFVRQIIGWREYVRGIYWREMPAYVDLNALDATADLPDLYWTGVTDMACLAEVMGQTLDIGHAHHIQRLMITGTFAMLMGVDPLQVHQWYLAVYVDAYEWVELPNTLGMSQYGDGGLMATKPYAASAAYVNRMSNYCGACRYDPKKRLGDGACPWNALYWDFVARHADRWRGNNRMLPILRNWERFDPDEQAAIRAAAAAFRAGLPAGGYSSSSVASDAPTSGPTSGSA